MELKTKKGSIILIKLFTDIEDRNTFAMTHRVIADQTHIVEWGLQIYSFYEVKVCMCGHINELDLQPCQSCGANIIWR